MNTEQETNTRVEESELNLGDILQTVLANCIGLFCLSWYVPERRSSI